MSSFNSNNFTNSSNYLYSLRKQIQDELDLPDPQELLQKQNELEEKEQWIKNKLEEINKKEKMLELRKKEIDTKTIELDKQTNANNQKDEELKLLESKLNQLDKSIEKNNLLPKVAEKNILGNFMINIAYPSKKDELDKMMLDDTEYIVYHGPGRYGCGQDKLIITNKGKMFYNLIFPSRISGFLPPRNYYANFDIKIMNKKILDALIIMTSHPESIYDGCWISPYIEQFVN